MKIQSFSLITWILSSMLLFGMMSCQPEEVDPCELQLPDCDVVKEPVEKVESEACKARRGDITVPVQAFPSLYPALIGPDGPFVMPPNVSLTGQLTDLFIDWPNPDSLMLNYEFDEASFRWQVNGVEVSDQMHGTHEFEQPGNYEIAHSCTVEKYYVDGDTCKEEIKFEDTKVQIEVLQNLKLVLTDITYVWNKRGACNEDIHLQNYWERCADIYVISKDQNVRTSTLWDKRWQDDPERSWPRNDTLQLIADHTWVTFKVYDEDKGAGTTNDDLHHEYVFTPENTQNWSSGTHELRVASVRNGIEYATLKITLEAI